jgi:hypothetical protein
VGQQRKGTSEREEKVEKCGESGVLSPETNIDLINRGGEVGGGVAPMRAKDNKNVTRRMSYFKLYLKFLSDENVFR